MEGKVDRERILTSTPKDHTSPADRHERKTLQTLQLSATGKKLNGGKHCAVQQKDNSEGKQKSTQYEEAAIATKSTHSSSQMVKVYEDLSLSEHISLAHCSRLTQTDDSMLEDLIRERLQHVTGTDDSGRESGYIDQEAYDLMVKEEVSESYWKDLAEERRRALKESLAENENLYSKLKMLSEENTQLKGENAYLLDVAAKADALKELLKGVLSDDDDDGVSERDSDDGVNFEEGECIFPPSSGPDSHVTDADQATDGCNRPTILDTDSREKDKQDT